MDPTMLRKITRTAGRLAKTSANKMVVRLTRRVKKQVKKCKSSKSVRTISRVLNKNMKTARPAQLIPDPISVVGGDTPLSMKMAKKKKKKNKNNKVYTEEDMTKACNKLIKRAGNVNKDAVMSGLFSASLASDEMPAPRGVDEVTKMLKSKALSVSDIYHTVSTLLQSVPTSATTCARLCPCAPSDMANGLCSKPQSHNFDGDCAVAGSRCSVTEQREVAEQCGGGSMVWKYTYRYNGDNGKEVCHYYNEMYHCDRSSPLSCVGGEYSQLKCCLSKCGRKLCVDKVSLYDTLGVKSEADGTTCTLKNLAADLSHGTRVMNAECRAKCQELFQA